MDLSDQQHQPVINEEPQMEQETLPERQIAQLWRRLLALLIDLAFGAVVQLLLAFLMAGWTYQLGPWGRFIGFGWYSLYFGILNSNLRNGQTVGKKMLGIAVVDQSGNYLDVGRSFLRAFILFAPQLLNNWQVPFLESPLAIGLVTFLVVGIGLTTFYGVLINRQTRQGLHDWLSGSIVVMAEPDEANGLPETSYFHRWVIIGLLAATLLLSIASGGWQYFQNADSIQLSHEEEALTMLYEQLLESGRYFDVGVHLVNRQNPNSGEIFQDLQIIVWVKGECDGVILNCDVLVDTLARFVFDQYQTVNELDGIKITVRNGYDFGLLRVTSVRGAELPLEIWRERLNLEETAG